ncbi:APOV1 protein, partial [Ceuthmochares aereus]|nr:APOV1 protein [Ceuthmochares aereus]
MLQSRALVIALMLLLSTTLTEVQSKAVLDPNHRDWWRFPDTIVAYIYEVVKNMSPKAAQFLLDAAEFPVVVEIRNFYVRGKTKLSIMVEQLKEKMKNLCYTKFIGY